MNKKVLSWILPAIPVLIAAIVFLQLLWQFHHSGTVVFYGDDTYGHLDIMNHLRAGMPLGLNQPALLEWIVLHWSQLFHTDPIRTYSAFAILSLPLMTLAVSVFAYQFFNSGTGIIAGLLLAFVSIQPVQNYQDGTIPNIYAIGVLFPLLLLACYKTATAAKAWQRLLALLSAVLLFFGILLTHHLSTLILGLTLFLTTLIFSVWLAAHLKKWRALAVLPPLVLLIIGWIGIKVLRPEAALQLLTTVGSFQHHFPWFHFARHNDLQPAWNTFTYAHEVSSILFETAIAALPFLLKKAWNEPRASRVFIILIIISWLLLYWLGSLTSLSYQPGRLARDLPLPGSIAAAYLIWWLCTTLYPRNRAILIAFLLVFLASAPYSIGRRYQLMTNTPKTVFTAQDDTLLSSLPAGEIGVYSPNFYWQAVATARGHSYTTLNTSAAVADFVHQKQPRCIIQLYYKISIAGGQPNASFATPVSLSSTYTLTTYEDSVRRLFLSCKKATNPRANTSQNI